MASPHSERHATAILAAMLLAEGYWCVLNLVAHPAHFIASLGFAAGRAGTAQGWVLGVAVAALYVWRSARLPSVREHLWRPSALKALALVMALAAAILEEAFARCGACSVAASALPGERW
jgi:hypothetical protein